jgi:hypothetical protein
MTLCVATYLWRDPARDSQRRGYTFNHDHVRVLRNMVRRNLSVPHRFVCVADEAIEDIETVPLDWRKHVPGTVCIRLMQHNPDWCRQNLGERVLSLDLDVVITGSLDALVSRAEDIVLWRNPNWPAPQRAFYQSSVQLFSAGARPGLWADFDPAETPKWMNWRFGGREQAWLSERLEWNEAHFTAERDGVYGAGRLGGKGVGSELPDNACIVSFPGAREPSQAETQALHPWIKEHYW